MLKTCGAGVSIKPGVERKRNPRTAVLICRKRAERAQVDKTELAAKADAHFVGFFILVLVIDLGFRFAPPQALRFCPRRGLIDSHKKLKRAADLPGRLPQAPSGRRSAAPQ
jgi:hypothetical protein